MAPALAVATGVVVGNCKGRKVYLNKLFEKIEPVLLFRLDPVFRLNLKFSIAAYSGLWETSALLAVVHNYPQGSAWPNTGCSDRDLLWAIARAKKFVRTNFLNREAKTNLSSRETVQTLTSKQFLCAMCEVSACTQGIQFSIHIYQGLKMLRRNLFLLLPLTMLIPNIVRSEELWTEEAEKRALETVRSIINKGFIPSAISGNLPLKVFLKYLEQNALYLKNYADVLSDLALKTSNREESDFLRKSSKEATALVEYTKELYEHIGKKKFPTIIKPCMENSEYIQFESNLVRNSSFSIGLASVYPCFWVYGEIGKAIQAKAILIENPYHSWLEGLGDPQYLKTVDQIRGFLNEHAVKLKDKEKNKMTEAFLKGCNLEQKFFDSAFHN